MSEHPVARDTAEVAGLLLAAALAASAVLVAVLARRATPEWFGLRRGHAPHRTRRRPALRAQR